MPDPMIGSYEDPPRAERVEVITSVQRRRRWSTEEKVRIVEETYLPGNSVSLVARRYGIAGNQLFTWRRLMAQGALTAAGAGEEVVPASELRAAHQQIRLRREVWGEVRQGSRVPHEGPRRPAGLLRLPGRALGSPAHLEPYRKRVLDRAAQDRQNQGIAVAIQGQADGLQTRYPASKTWRRLK